jgi:4-amino-4-deoxy-L-arabinose transferase-like glycosyltransferase
MKPVRLAAAATLALPRWALFALGLLYILPGLVGRDPWKDDAASFGIMWTMAQGGLNDWLLPNIAGLAQPDDGPLVFWLGALCIKLLGPLLGDVMAARASSLFIFLLSALSVWTATFHLGRRSDAQPLRLAFGGQPEPSDYGRTLADTALLIYLGSLGLLWHSHLLVPAALQVALLAYALYRAVRYVELPGWRNAALIGLALGALTLTRDAVPAIALAVSLLVSGLFLRLAIKRSLAHLGFAVLCASLVVAIWVVPATLAKPYGQSPIPAWLASQALQFAMPTQASLSGYFRFGIWLFWPAWPFALWAVYAWRRQSGLLHIVLPLTFMLTLTVLWLCRPVPDQSRLLLMLPPLAILAAFGLPTMQRGAINAIDYFSVMVLTMLAALMWLFWSATFTGWPAKAANNVLKLIPGFKPEFQLIATLVAALASIGWIMLVLWRISRQPSVLWRAVVLSSGGLILLWVLVTTLFLPYLNYGKSYASVARQIEQKLPANPGCIETNVGAAQRASFAYFAKLTFAGVQGDGNCPLLLLQDSVKLRDEIENLPQYRGKDWVLVWEGRRPSDRDERFRLFRHK